MNKQGEPTEGSGWYGDLLRYYPVLNRLPPDLSQLFRQRVRLVTVSAGAIAFDEDSGCTGLILPLQGSVRVVRTGPGGREILLYRVKPGEICILSVSCLLGHSSYSARGVVETDLTGASLPGDLFEVLVSRSQAFRSYVFGLFGERLSALLQLVEEVAFHRLDTRLAGFLLRRARETGTSEIATTHQDLADQIGTVREMISRVLDSLENEGAVAVSRGQVRILRPELLQAIAGTPQEPEALPGRRRP